MATRSPACFLLSRVAGLCLSGLLAVLPCRGANTPPTISTITSQSINENSSSALIPFTVGDAQTPAGSLSLVATTNVPTLIPISKVVFGGSGANRTVRITPAPGQHGTANVRVRVNDADGGWASTLFSVNVNAAPTISTISNQALQVGGSATLAFAIGDLETAPDGLSLVVTTNNPTLFPASRMVLGGSGTSRTLKLTPAVGKGGTANVRVRVTDPGGATNSTLFTVTVNAAPTITLIGSQTIQKNASSEAIAFTVGDAETDPGSLGLVATTNVPTLVPIAQVVFGGSGAARTVTITPAAGQTGVANVRVRVTDANGGWSSTLFTVTVVDEGPAPILIDHTHTNLPAIPASAILAAKSSLKIAYGHTSHGSQLVTGMEALAGADGLYSVASGGAGGALDLREPWGFDLGNPDFTQWAVATRSYLNDGADVNVVIWSWCGQVSWASEADITTYLTQMSQLEADFPRVKFVYMTGHLDGTGTGGNHYARNEQIRAYCRTNHKILFDFADIESYDPDGLVNYMPMACDDGCTYDSDGNGNGDRNWASEWIAAHPSDPLTLLANACGECAHSDRLNCIQKGRAAWWLWARLAGWRPGNLIVNGGAELGQAGDGFQVLTVPGWTSTGGFTVATYGVPGGFPLATDPGPVHRGRAFFTGGSAGSSQATQMIDVSAEAAALDTGLVRYTLSAYLGGYASHNDRAALSLQFQSATGTVLGSAQIGPVTNAERGNITGLLFRSATGLCPVGTRRILAVLDMTQALAYNDGYADECSLMLTK